MTTYMKIFEERISGLSKGVDETVDSWFLMSSPAPVFGVVLLYLAFVLKIGPEFMKNRKPMDLKRIMVFYNAFQVCYSIWMCRTSIQESNVISSIFSKKCEINRTREQNLTLYSGAWFYFFSKIIDLLDTTFFVLRKKNNQVSFLHVYHHTITVLFSWGYLKYAPGEQGVIIGILNSGVHIMMYFYYMVAAMGPQYQKYLWWKKYLTTLQMVQFILIMVHAFQLLFIDCNYPKAFVWWIGMHAVMFFFLFNEFYKAAYRNRLMKKNALLANGHAKPNGYCKSINAHDDLAMPQPTAATVTPVSKANGSVAPLTNGHANGLSNGYGKQLANGNAPAMTTTQNGSGHKGGAGPNGLLTNGYATKLLDDASQDLKQRKTQK